MTEGYLIGVDVGTYSSKGVLVRADGTLVASHTVPHGLDMPHPGHFEHDAEQVWWHDFVTIVRALLSEAGIDPRQVLGIGASAIGSCVLPVDEHGRALRPGILYGIDTRASQEIEYLENELGKEEIFQTSGAHLSSQASGPKVLWVRNHEPEVYARARWFLTSEAYLVMRLTGQPSIDIYTASGYAPLYDTRRREWVDDRVARLITPRERLPQAYWSHQVVGRVTAEAARETGLAEGTPVVAGTTDAAAEAISAGVAENGDMMVMFGSSIFFIMKTEALIPTQRFWSANFLEEGSFAFLGGMSTSGSLTTWFRDQFAQAELAQERQGGENAYAVLARQAAESPAGAHGLVALPYFQGERTPIHDPRATGVWFGLSLSHTRADLYRSILESVAYGIRHNFELMQAEGVHPRRILAVGGGTRNPLWLRIVADVCGLELVVPEQQIGASYGDAFLAAVGVGLYDNLTQIRQWVRVRETLQPRPDDRAAYDFNYSLYRELYERASPLMHRLSDHRAG